MDEEFVIARTFAAPRARVFAAWTEAGHLAHWWGPVGMQVDVVALDVRPGGLFHYRMTPPAGPAMWGRFDYREVVSPERLVLLNGFSDEAGGLTRHPLAPTWPLQMLNTTTFEDRDGATLLTLRSTAFAASEIERATFVTGFASMTMGFGGTFDQLERYLATL